MKWIFLPGLDGSGFFFEPFLRVLPGDIEPVTIAFPPEERWGYGELFEWLLPQLPTEEPFLIVAESFSGPLAVRVAASEPKGMVGAVISASFVRNPLPRGLQHLPIAWILRRRLPECLVRFLFADQATGQELIDLFYRAIHYSPPEVVAHRARAALRVDETESLRNCRLPLLFLDATADRLIGPACTNLVRSVRPDLPIIPIAAPHFLLQLRQKECVAAIEKFLAN